MVDMLTMVDLIDTEAVILFEDVSAALMYYEAEPALRAELGVQLLQKLGGPCPAPQDQAGYTRPRLPECCTGLDGGECAGLFALTEGLEYQVASIQGDSGDSRDEGTHDVGVRREVLSVISYAEACDGGWVSGCRGREALTAPAGAESAQRPDEKPQDAAEEKQWARMVRNVFAQLTAAAGKEQVCDGGSFGARLCGGWLQFEFGLAEGGGGSEESDAARAVAKSLLGQEHWGGNLGVWRAFGQAEANVGNVKEAQKIFDAAMMTPTPNAPSTADESAANAAAVWERFAVRRAYAELEIFQGSRERALHVLTSGLTEHEGFISIRPSKKKKKSKRSKDAGASDGPPPVSPIALATAQRAYERFVSAAGNLSQQPDDNGCGRAVHAVVCGALLELLSPVGFSGMRAVFDQALRDVYDPSGKHPPPLSDAGHAPAAPITAGSPRRIASGCEALYAAYIRYTVAHFAGGGAGRVVSPRVVRDILLRALDAFPSNPTFLSCWLLVEGSSQIAANLRAFFHSHCRREDEAGSSEPALWLFAAHFEAKRALGESAGAAGAAGLRVVNLYERALACPEIQHSGVVWSAYLSFLLQRDALLQHSLVDAEDAALAAKRVFFRAIRACGEVKGLWMAAFNSQGLRGLMSKAELTELNELMIEKELRMHVELDEVELPFFSLD